VTANPPETAPTAVAKFAAELADELQEIQGHEITLDGKTYLVTTEAQILEWIAWHVHQPEEDAYETGEPAASCPCGWTAGPFKTWSDAANASNAHRAAGLAQLTKGGAR
jgi:hypothetical protein